MRQFPQPAGGLAIAGVPPATLRALVSRCGLLALIEFLLAVSLELI